MPFSRFTIKVITEQWIQLLSRRTLTEITGFIGEQHRIFRPIIRALHPRSYQTFSPKVCSRVAFKSLVNFPPRVLSMPVHFSRTLSSKCVIKIDAGWLLLLINVVGPHCHTRHFFGRYFIARPYESNRVSKFL